jgi:type IV pilus assembly protein PilO
MVINLNKLKGLPAHLQIIIAALPSVIFIALFIFLVFMPKNKEREALDTKLVTLDQEIASSEVKIKRLDKLIVENKLLKTRLARLREQLPEEKEVSVLLKQISELGLRSGLEILFWRPEPRKTEPEGLYVEIPVRVEVMADYHMLGDFFSHISRLPRLVNIADINLTVGNELEQQRRGIINAKFMARTFASVSPGDIVPAAKGKKTK